MDVKQKFIVVDLSTKWKSKVELLTCFKREKDISSSNLRVYLSLIDITNVQ